MMFRCSDLLGTLRQHFADVYRESCYLYGDSACPIVPWLMVPYRSGSNPAQALFNKKLSDVQIAVEWGFVSLTISWPHGDFARKPQMLLCTAGAS